MAITEENTIHAQIVYLFEVKEELNQSSMINLNFDGETPSSIIVN